MSTRILNIALSTIVNLSIWLIGASCLCYPESGLLFWMLIALGFAVIGGVLSQPLAGRLAKSGQPPGALICVIIGALPLLSAFGYFQIVKTEGEGLLLWLLYGLALAALTFGIWFTWRLFRIEINHF